jgi:CheY-like chemotaxis protein
MSHELRTPLNSILGFAQILQRSKTMTDEELDNIRIIYQSGSHLLTLIDDILDLAKIEAQKMELDPTDFPFPSFLRGVVEICRIRAQQKGISFTYQPTFQLPTTIHADEKRLRQVLINLLVNAIKFTNTGGVTFKVEVMGNGEWETRGTRRGLGAMGNGEEPNQIPIPNLQSSIFNPKTEVQNWKIRFQVEDTGVGMTSDQLEKIFLPFEQVGNTHYKAEGAGLGLAISQKLIQMMGSTLQVTSQPGVGSIFWMDLDLPVATALPQTAKLDQPSAAKPGQLDLQLAQQLPLRILLAEDNAVNQKVALHLLKLLGYRADVVQNGQEVISSLRRQSYDVVLMDVQMPEMDGLEATRRICQEWSKGSRPRIIAVTANAMQEDREECLAAGMNDYISKPIRLEALVQALRQCRALNAGVL